LGNNKAEVFIFGSAARAARFGDVDIAVKGRVSRDKIRQIASALENSDLPYFFDVIDFFHSAKEFQGNVLNNKIIWLIRH